jgi:hypothetical protein
MTLVSIGDQVAEGNCAFHSRFNRAVNFQRDGRLVSVVNEQIGAGPLNIVIRNLNAGPMVGWVLRSLTRRAEDCAPLHTAPLEITADTVIFEGRRFRFTDSHRYNSRAEVPPSRFSHFRRNLSLFDELLRTASPRTSLAFLLDAKWIEDFRKGVERSFAEHMRRSVRRLFRGHLLEGVRNLRGCGLGLTPSGDDFLAGLLIGLHLRQSMSGENLRAVADAVFHAAKAGNIFSNTFLDLARRGLLFERMKALVAALTRDSAAAVRKAAERLFAIGETSGADLGTGFLMTVRAGNDVLQRWKAGIRSPLPSEVP